ncbi:hypothetical protein DQ04_02141030 [Trypanosoma grayi]|uniref:hypothetical protein n=1 Tax=Trypanosoma grayi TaxID=71804 RepID=UPI0004F3F8A3|nr:hypothetical protein DQ04_02141030 [Trypanosoma grayi]KEG11925.1 hypothetical protein DQ04_02141030 [Trypanosoma grayi]
MEGAASSSSPSALVIWGSTGRRLQFTRQDLQMPDTVKARPNHHFFEKQWDAVAGFWMNRVLKEAALQHMSVSDVVQCIVHDIDKRWEQRKREKALYKRRKRLLDPSGTTAAGVPSQHVLLTNILSLDAYREHVAADTLEELVAAVLAKVEEVAREKVVHHTLLVDDEENTDISKDKENKGNDDSDKGMAEEPAKKRKLEGSGEATFDDHVALVCTFTSQEKAASVVAELHGSTFDSRAVLCRFYAL